MGCGTALIYRDFGLVSVSPGLVESLECPIIPYSISADSSLPDALFLFDSESIYVCTLIAGHNIGYWCAAGVCTTDGQTLWFGSTYCCLRRLDVSSKSVTVPGIMSARLQNGKI